MAEEDKEFIRVKETITNDITVNDNITINGVIVTDQVEANGTNGTPSFTNILPSGVGTTTIAKWLKVTQGGTVYFIPMWT